MSREKTFLIHFIRTLVVDYLEYCTDFSGNISYYPTTKYCLHFRAMANELDKPKLRTALHFDFKRIMDNLCKEEVTPGRFIALCVLMIPYVENLLKTNRQHEIQILIDYFDEKFVAKLSVNFIQFFKQKPH